MKKEEAIKRILEIQRGKGSTRKDFPEDMKGKVAKSIWNDSDFTYGFEYGEIHGLMSAFNLTKEDIHGKV